MLLCSGTYFDHLPPSSDALQHHVFQASYQYDSFGVTHSCHALLSRSITLGLADGFQSMAAALDIQASYLQSATTACELQLRKEEQNIHCKCCVVGVSCTVEPLSNDHPRQRPSLSYDHMSCDGQGFLFVYESLTSDHPSYTTTPM